MHGNWAAFDDDRVGNHVLAIEFPPTSICDIDLDLDVDDANVIAAAVGQSTALADVMGAPPEA